MIFVFEVFIMEVYGRIFYVSLPWSRTVRSDNDSPHNEQSTVSFF